jgi:N-acetyl-anhydromuramyl-L-alanine amidase AmpD
MAARSYPFIQARWFTKGPRGGPIQLAVMHTVEVPEKPTTAEAVARYFATTDRKASAHWCCDADSTVGCVRESDIAYAAPGSNHNGVHVELAGYAAQTGKDWADPYSQRMLKEQAAPLVRAICKRHAIPTRFVDAAGLKAGQWGITTHAEVTKAFHRSSHTDPGAGFPIASFIEMVQGTDPQGGLSMADVDKLLERIEDVETKVEKTYNHVSEKTGNLAERIDRMAAELAEVKALVQIKPGQGA